MLNQELINCHFDRVAFYNIRVFIQLTLYSDNKFKFIFSNRNHNHHAEKYSILNLNHNP